VPLIHNIWRSQIFRGLVIVRDTKNLGFTSCTRTLLETDPPHKIPTATRAGQGMRPYLASLISEFMRCRKPVGTGLTGWQVDRLAA
jgi:hypothetical protein